MGTLKVIYLAFTLLAKNRQQVNANLNKSIPYFRNVAC